MKTELLDYDLPAELIAQKPAQRRTESRLLVLDRAAGRCIDSRFDRLTDWLRPGDCLVLNDTKVLPARFYAHRRTGAALEGLYLSQTDGDLWEVMLKGARKVRVGESICIEDRCKQDYCLAELIEKRDGGECLLRVQAQGDVEAVLERIGFPPLPPYIRRDSDLALAAEDRDRYQTVYARRPGAVAAPTAGLHFSESLMRRLVERGVRLAYVTLHVGTGTFKPVTTEVLEDHPIHHEWFRIEEPNAELINAARRDGGRIVAVGTTVTRVLETVGTQRRVEPAEGSTNLFISPGYTFEMIDAMITNFHLPRTTLLALVSALAGLDQTLAAYRHAVEQKYRFYSYGDAMLIL